MKFSNFYVARTKNSETYEVIGTAGNVPRDISITGGLANADASVYAEVLNAINSDLDEGVVNGIHVIGEKWLFVINPDNTELKIYYSANHVVTFERKSTFGFDLQNLINTVKTSMIALTGVHLNSTHRIAVENFNFNTPELNVVLFMNKQFDSLKAQFMPKKV